MVASHFKENCVVIHRSTMLGVLIEDHKLCKQWCKEAWKKYQLWDDIEVDLDEL